jgi:hypothetical protein
MPGRKIILQLLFALLFVFIDNNAGRACSVPATTDVASTTINNIRKIVPVSALSFSRRAITREYIKVRYMGGQCDFNIPPAIVHYSIREYIDSPYSVRSRFFIPHRDRLVFKLRGPPCA